MTPTVAPTSGTHLRAAIRLRFRVIRRRFASPLEGVLLAGLVGLAWLAGGEIAERTAADDPRPIAGVTALLVLGVAAAAAVARGLLYRAPELVLLLTNGLLPRGLVRLRLLELTVLGAVLVTPIVAAAAGFRAELGLPLSPLVALGLPLAALALAGAGLLLGWTWARGPAWRVGLMAAGGAGVAGGLALPGGPLGALAHPQSPGGALVAALSGDVGGLAALALAAAFLAVVAERVGALGHGRGLDLAGVADTRAAPSGLWRLAGWLARPLGRPAAQLLQRDLAILTRGGFPRGLAVLALLPLALAIAPAVASDRSLEPWHLELVGLLLAGVLATAAGYLFGVDFPRARSRQRVLERSQPLRAWHVLLSRWAPAFLLAAALGLGVSLLVMRAERPPAAGWLVLEVLLLALIATQDAAAFGLRAEAAADAAEAAAYPLRAGTLVVIFSLGLAAHPLAILAYPLLGYVGFTRSAMRIWERAEVGPDHQGAA